MQCSAITAKYNKRQFFKRVLNILCKLVKIWYLMLAAVCTERGRPLSVNLSVLPVWSVFHTKSYDVRIFHCLAGNSCIMRLTFQPFSTRTTLTVKRKTLSSEVSTGMLTQMTSTMTIGASTFQKLGDPFVWSLSTSGVQGHVEARSERGGSGKGRPHPWDGGRENFGIWDANWCNLVHFGKK